LGRSILIIANPSAGRGQAGRGAEAARERLATLGMRAEVYRTMGSGDAERAAREAAVSFDVVVAAGGDGTVHEVANGLADTGAAMGVLPLGWMNILAREIRVPFDPVKAADWISRAEPSPVALGVRDGRYFVLMAGVGYDACGLENALAMAAARGGKVGLTDYLGSAWKTLRTYGFPRIEVEADGWKGGGAFGFVANCARYGLNLRIAREARLEEPMLDLVLFPSGRASDVVRYVAAILAGVHGSMRGVVCRKVTGVRLRVEGGERVPCQLDGEVSTALPATIRVAPGALRLLRSVIER
jgi:diacylglycerol kinase (ATP)